MEKTSTNTLSPSFSFPSFIEFLLFNGILKWVFGFTKLCSSSPYFLQSPVEFIFGRTKGWSGRKIAVPEQLLENKVTSDGDEVIIEREDVEVIMEKLKIFGHAGDDMLNQKLISSKDLKVLFEDMEPTVDEVKEAFDVFDENRDGFVDAKELQRVLCILGFKEGSKAEDCENMINVFDDNKDGRIDFDEFVKLMHNSFC